MIPALDRTRALLDQPPTGVIPGQLDLTQPQEPPMCDHCHSKTGHHVHCPKF